MSKRWSKLQKELYGIRTSDINMQIHCSIYRMKSSRGTTDIPRYWITVNKQVVWDYPKDFIHNTESQRSDLKYYPYVTDISEISSLIRENIDTLKDELLSKDFNNDHWGLTYILKAIDRRIGKRRLKDISLAAGSEAVDLIVKQRMGIKDQKCHSIA